LPVPVLNENYDKSVSEQIKRLALIYARYLNGGHVARYYLIQQTAFVTKALYVFCDNKVETLKSIKDAKGIRNHLRDKLGMIDVRDWLSTKDNAEQILKESGQEKIFEGLWKFRYCKATEMYHDDVDIFKKKIKDLKAWFKIIDFLITRSSFRNRIHMTNARNGVVLWRKDTVFSILLISMTLNSEKTEFSLVEIENFLRLVDDYDNWHESLLEKIKSFPADSGIIELFESDEMRSLIVRLKTSSFRTLISFAENLPLKREERPVYKDLCIKFNMAVNYAYEFRSPASKSKQLEDARSKLSEIISRLNTKTAYDFIAKKKVFLFWLEKNKLTELLVWDTLESGGLIKLARKFELIDNNMEYFLSSKHTFGEFFQAISKNEQPLAQLSTWLNNNKRIGDYQYAHGWKDRLEEEAYFAIASKLSVSTFRDLLEMVEKNMPVNSRALPNHFCLAIYLKYADEHVPDCVVKNLLAIPWYLFIQNNSTKNLLLQRVKNMEENAIREKEKREN